MRKLYCLLIAKYRFRRFLRANETLNATITKEQTKEYEKNLAQYIYKKKFGDKKC